MSKLVTFSKPKLKMVFQIIVLLAVFGSSFFLPGQAVAKCADVPMDLVCPNLVYSFSPANPAVGDEIIITARWIDIRTGQAVANPEWLATRGKPAYIWLWDHYPSEMESIAYVAGTTGKAALPQILVPLTWNSETQEYQGKFILPNRGGWYFRLGTVVPDAMAKKMAADSDYVGAIEYISVPASHNLITGWVVQINLAIHQVMLRLTGLFSR